MITNSTRFGDISSLVISSLSHDLSGHVAQVGGGWGRGRGDLGASVSVEGWLVLVDTGNFPHFPVEILRLQHRPVLELGVKSPSRAQKVCGMHSTM